MFEAAPGFMARNCDLPVAIGPDVYFGVIEIDGHLSVVIVVGESATGETLRKAIPYAVMWRDRLFKWQGPWLGGGKTELMVELHLRRSCCGNLEDMARYMKESVDFSLN